MAFSTQALKGVSIWLKSVSNEGHLKREARTVFLPHLPTHCSGVTETSNVTLSTHAVKEHVLSKSVSNKGHLLVMTKQFSAISPRTVQGE
jgi:hypothetical protein